MRPVLAGATIVDVGDELSGGPLGGDPVGSVRLAAAEGEAAVRSSRPVDGKVRLSYGDEEPDEYIRQVVADLLVHGWDLAVAVGADTESGPELVNQVAAWYTEREEVYRAGGAIAA